MLKKALPYITWGLIQDFKKRTIKGDLEEKGRTTETKILAEKFED